VTTLAPASSAGEQSYNNFPTWKKWLPYEITTPGRALLKMTTANRARRIYQSLFQNEEYQEYLNFIF
jgi:hypothetical protein